MSPNALIDTLPQAVEIDGAEYAINTDFRTCLKVIIAFEDTELSTMEKAGIMLELMYPVIPPNAQKAAELAVLFLNCGEDGTTEHAGSGEGRVYSFTQDAKYIYSAIKQSYHIDLDKETDLHWWRFCAMFLDLNEDCFFNRLICLRRAYKKGKMTKEERELYASLRGIVDLQETMTVEEQGAYNEFMARLGG